MGIILVILLSVIPSCPSEDSSWCRWNDKDDVYIALWMRDPAPYVIKLL